MGRRAAAVSTALAMLVVGCESGDPGAAPSESLPFAVFPSDPNDEITPGELNGTLLLENGCLLVKRTSPVPEVDGRVFALHLPSWVVWKDGALTIGMQTYRPGDEIGLPGAPVSREVAIEHGLPETCPDVSVWSY